MRNLAVLVVISLDRWLVFLEHSVEETVLKFLCLGQFVCYQHVVTTEPPIAQVDSLDWIHPHEVLSVLSDDISHVVECYARHYPMNSIELG